MNIEEFIQALETMQQQGIEKISLTEVIDMAYNTEEYQTLQKRKQWYREMEEYKKSHKTTPASYEWPLIARRNK